MTRLAESVATFITLRCRGSRIPGSLGHIVLAALVACLWSPPTAAQESLRRVALVIGNSNYLSAPALQNPRNDAHAISATLRHLGFAVQEGVDLDSARMASMLRTFGLVAETADVALVFYAGHGIQVDGQNYLLPVDVTLDRERDLNYEAVPLDLILSEVSQARKLAVVILDACRDNPFAGKLQASMGSTRSTLVGRGLGQVDAPADTLVAFATRDGAVAEDGTGFNSPFTTALLTHLGEPGVEIGQYFRRVRDSVVTSTNGRQEPFVYGSLSADQFYLNPPLQQAANPPISDQLGGDLASRGLSVEQASPANSEIMFWDSIRESDNTADFEAYLEQFPEGVFAGLARNQIAELAGTSGRETIPRQSAQMPANLAVVAPPSPDIGLTAAEKREIQTSLQRLGLYAGAVDAQFGRGTRGAIAAFQRSVGDDPSGALTAAQVALLHQRAAAVRPPTPQLVAVPSAPEPVEVPPAAPEMSAGAETAALPRASGQFGAIASSGNPTPSKTGYCTGMSTQAEANECALAECGPTCDVQITFGAGQCGAYAEASEKTSGIGFGVGATRDAAVEEAQVACRRDASRGRYCRVRVSRCNP